MAYELTYNGNTLPVDITQQLINYAENELNVPPSYLITKLHYEGLWGGSEVAQSNNNWGGMTWGGWDSPHTRESGVIVTIGSARPAIEGGYYIRYASVQDFLIDWSYLIRRGGSYNVADSDTFNDAVKGMFIYGGADYDYATMNVEGSQLRYELYLEGMLARRNAINNANDGKLDLLDNESHGGDGGDGSGIIAEVLQIINQYKNNINIVADLSGIKKHLDKPVSKFSDDVYANEIVKITKMYHNMLKVNVNIDLDTIDMESNVDQVFNQMIQAINQLDDGGGELPDDKPFPPVSNYTNITAVYGYSDGYDGWHAGLDFGGIVAGVDGDPIYATMDGTVEIAEFNNGGLGNVVWINHSDDAYFSAYAHLSGFNTTAGSTVKKGDVIGYMGNTGYSFGTHLHFVVATVLWGNNESNTIDPKTYLGI